MEALVQYGNLHCTIRWLHFRTTCKRQRKHYLPAYPAYGGYVGLSRLLADDGCGRVLWSNLVAGYAYQGNDETLVPAATRRVRQAFSLSAARASH